MKQEVLKTVLPIVAVCQSLSSMFCRMSGRLFHYAGIPKDHLTREKLGGTEGGEAIIRVYYVSKESIFYKRKKWEEKGDF